MKSSEPKKLSKHMRRALEEQVQEYVDNYHPQLGKVSVAISPTGAVASVRCNSKPKGHG